MPFARAEVFFVRLGLLFVRGEAADDDLALRDPFAEERPRLLDRLACPRSLATAMFNLRDSGLPAFQA